MKKLIETAKSNLASILMLLLLLVLGVIIIAAPSMLAQSLFHVVGWGLLLTGAFKVVHYFMKDASRAIVGWELAVGAAMALAGLTMVLMADALVTFLPFLFGSLLFIGGVVKFQISFDLKRMNDSQWYIALILAVVSISLGWLAVYHPFGLDEAYRRFLGSALILEALADGAVAVWFQSKRKKFQAASGRRRS